MKIYAFPCDTGGEVGEQAGMTLRDYFAGQALPAIVSYSLQSPHQAVAMVRIAYEIADAMLAERDK